MIAWVATTGAERVKAVFALLGLAACALALSPHPPPDPVWDLLARMARSAGMGLVKGGWSLFGAVLVLSGGLFAWILRGDRFRRGKPHEEEDHETYREPRRLKWVDGLVLAGLLLFGIGVISLLRTWGERFLAEPPVHASTVRPGPTPATAAPDVTSRKDADPGTHSPPFFAAWLALAGAGLGTAILLVFRHRNQRRDPPSRSPGPPVPLSEAVAATRRRLELGDELRDAVIRCYDEMCHLFAEAPERTRTLTAREFQARLLARGAGEPEVAALTAVFEKARYSLEACTESDRRHAVEALRTLERRYGGEDP